MTPHGLLTLVLVLAAVVAMVTDRLPTALIVLGTDVLLLVVGVLKPEDALSGFGNPAPITVGALFIVARAVQKTGAMQPLLESAVGHRDQGRRGLWRLLAPVTACSAFLNHTPLVAMLAPPVTDWAESRGVAPSKYLMPLSFASIIGGLVTLIGTSTNLVAAGMMSAHGMAPLGMFELTPVGIPIAMIGLGLLVLLSPRLLPGRKTARQQFQQQIREFVYQTVVENAGPYDGRSVEQAGLRHLQGVFLVEVERNGHVIAPATPTTVLRGGDRLTFSGRVDMIRDLQSRRGLRAVEHEHAVPFAKPGHTFFQAVLGSGSELVGRTLRETDFRNRYQAAVVAIHRSGQRVNEKLGGVKMREGDALLLVADDGFEGRAASNTSFALVARLGGSMPVGTRAALIVAAIAIGVVVVAGLGLMPILQASLLACLLLLATGIMTPQEARNARDMDVLFTIAGAIGIGLAIEKSGLGGFIARGVIDMGGHWGPQGVLLALSVATVLLTNIITNKAAVVLMFHIALAAAHAMNVSERAYVIAVTLSASCSFITPIASQTNIIVNGMAGYKFSDFARLGVPLSIMMITLITLLVPIFWHF